MRRIFAAVILALSSLVLFAPSQAADNCVSWSEFVNVNPGSNPSTGTHKNVVRQRFGIAPSWAVTYRPDGDAIIVGQYDWAEAEDKWYRERSCSGNDFYRMWYNRYVTPGPNGEKFYNVGQKCHTGPAGPDQCWT